MQSIQYGVQFSSILNSPLHLCSCDNKHQRKGIQVGSQYERENLLLRSNSRDFLLQYVTVNAFTGRTEEVNYSFLCGYALGLFIYPSSICNSVCVQPWLWQTSQTQMVPDAEHIGCKKSSIAPPCLMLEWTRIKFTSNKDDKGG